MKYICVCLLFMGILFSQQSGILRGKVTDRLTGEALQGANIIAAGSGQGVSSDMIGNYSLPLPAGNQTVIFSFIGYKRITRSFQIEPGKNIDFSAEMEVSAGELDKVVVTATRTEKNLHELPTKVTVLDNADFVYGSALSLSDALSFQNGVRIEVDCQTCNFTQVRMNGLGGGYTQILINSRPVFSPLNGLYGLEQIPVSMLDRIEVVKGGGSALFGANAVGGTINIITKDPSYTHYSFTAHGQLPGGTASDAYADVNYSYIDETGKTGFSLFGVSRNRTPYDANNDGFSELPLMQNISAGLTSFYKTGNDAKISLDFHRIYEYRRGGDNIYRAPHLALQAEERTHIIYGGGITYDTPLPFRLAQASVYVSGQSTYRDHYTGTFGADAYGITDNTLWVTGLQANFTIPSMFGTGAATITTGAEHSSEYADDRIPGYDYRYNSRINLTGIYLQSDWKPDILTTLLAGLRMDIHSLEDQPVFSPRINILRNLSPELQLRLSYASGFRAAQAFDADLHIAMAGGGISRIVLDSSLTKESSLSYTASLDYNKPGRYIDFGYTIEGFYTSLHNAFITVDGGADPASPQNSFLLKTNGGTARVKGISLESRFDYIDMIELQAGVTLQNSMHSDPVQWSADAPAERKFLRTPDIYGFMFLKWEPRFDFNLSLTGIFTGPMDVPHLAGAGNLEFDRLEKSPAFFDMNLRLGYTFYNSPLGDAIELFAGVKNLLHHYQKDFDSGPLRDSNYIYGPAAPRTVFAGFRINPL